MEVFNTVSISYTLLNITGYISLGAVILTPETEVFNTVSITYTLLNIIGYIVLGVIATLLSQYLAKKWPSIRRRFSKAPDIGGEWETTFQEGGEEFHETVILKQIGLNVKGSITLVGENPKYRFEGTFINLLLVCTYYSTDPRDYERGAFALLYDTMRNLNGQYIFISNQAGVDKLFPSDYKWKRK